VKVENAKMLVIGKAYTKYTAAVFQFDISRLLLQTTFASLPSVYKLYYRIVSYRKLPRKSCLCSSDNKQENSQLTHDVTGRWMCYVKLDWSPLRGSRH